MDDEPWARIDLRISSQRLTVEEIGQLMGRDSIAEPDSPWAMDLTEEATVGLNEQLQAAKELLRGKADILAEMAEASITLCIGWTPRIPQDGIVLDEELIALLHRVRCLVLLDTYLAWARGSVAWTDS